MSREVYRAEWVSEDLGVLGSHCSRIGGAYHVCLSGELL